MAAWLSLLLALTVLTPVQQPLRAQPAPNPWPCVERQLRELGYSAVEGGEGGRVRAERRVGGSIARIKEAGAMAAGVATLGFIEPPVRRRFDELVISPRGARPDQPLYVAAALVIVDGNERQRRWPRARSVIDALTLSTRCGGGR